MAAPSFTNCPINVTSGGKLEVSGTTDDCATTTRSVKFNGVDIPHTWSCSGGGFKITIDPVPTPVDGKPNVIEMTVTQGGQSDPCDVLVQ